MDLIDIWRHQNPNQNSYTWSNMDRSQQSRLDFWLISSDIENSVDSVIIEPAVFTDHQAVMIKVNTASFKRNPNRDYWKLNKTLLQNKRFKKETQDIIEKFWRQANTINNFGKCWELMKFEIRNLAICTGKRIAKSKRENESQIITKIMRLSEKENLSEMELGELAALQLELDKMYEDKARGAFIRSRRKWLEQGEKCTKYFFNLEKRNYEVSSLSKLKINDQICEDKKLISQYVANFYQKLYAVDNESGDNIDLFIKGIEKEIKGINEGFKVICDRKVDLVEVQKCIASLKDNKSPGSDGLINEFYKTFIKNLAPFLVDVFEEAIDRGELPPTLRQGLIKLIPKPKKDKLSIENWRPISLLNIDAKLFAMIFAKRLKLGLEDIIDEEQSGFMPGRNICNNIRLVLDMIDYNDYVLDDSFILFVDFYKAFDAISHQFMFKTIHSFGFGKRFCKAVKTLYKDSNSSIGLAHGTTPRFNIKRGIRQGCPLSPFLFILVTQIMAIHIKKA